MKKIQTYFPITAPTVVVAMVVAFASMVFGVSVVTTTPAVADNETTITCIDGTNVTYQVGGNAEAACAGHSGYTTECADGTKQPGDPSNACRDHKGVKDASGTGPTCKTSILPATLCDGNSNSGGVWGILLFVLNILTAGVGIAAVGGFVLVAIMYTTGGDSPERIKKAKDMIVNIVIGLIAFGLMYALLQFIIPGGIFQ